jgi:hypothetical protein
LVLRGISDETLGVGESDERRSRPISLVIGLLRYVSDSSGNIKLLEVGDICFASCYVEKHFPKVLARAFGFTRNALSTNRAMQGTSGRKR